MPRPLVTTKAALVLIAMAGGAVSFFALRQCSPARTVPAKNNAPTLPRNLAVPAQENATEHAIRFYTARVGHDPEDTRSQNALAEYYLQRVREAGNEDYLPLALQAARASLAAVMAERNTGGLTALAHAEFANHDFAAARDRARQLIALTPGKSESHGILGDAFLELGAYDEAAQAFREMQSIAGPNADTEIRAARLAVLRGAPGEAREHFTTALALLLASSDPANETIAWCRWQMGETAFGIGDYVAAENHYRAALQDTPSSFRALGSLGRLCTARGDLASAINHYEQAVRIVPVVEFMAALGDLYQLQGRNKDATARYELVEQLGEHSQKVHGTPYDRRLALFLADHEMKGEEAYALARGEFDSGRHDIYGADALAWTALQAGRIDEAQAASKEALRLGTQDARLLYHAGMIARAAGEKAAAKDFLQRALSLNPHFDPLQSERARTALKDLGTP